MDLSEDSFAWADASSDSSEIMATEVNLNRYESDLYYGNASKEKLQSNRVNISQEPKQKHTLKKKKKQAVSEEVINNFNFINGSIKFEPNTDFTIQKSKKKIKSEKLLLNTALEEPIRRAEEYLNLRVKEEQALVEPEAVKHKKKKINKKESKKVEDQESDFSLPPKDEIDIKEQQAFVEPEAVKHKKKKTNKKGTKTVEDQESDFSLPPNNEMEIKEHCFDDPSLTDYEYSNTNVAESSRLAVNLGMKKEEQAFVEPEAVKHKKKKTNKKESKTVEDQESDFSLPPNDQIDIKEHCFDDPSLIDYEYLNTNVAENSHRKKRKKKKHSEDKNTGEITEKIDHKKKKNESHNTSTSKQSLDSSSGDNDSPFQDEENGSYNIVSSTLIKASDIDNNKAEEYEVPSDLFLNNTKSSDHISLIDGPLKKSRISDRIQFEEDNTDVDTEEHVPTNLNLISLKKFITSNTHLTPIHSKSCNRPTITQDDEVWLLKGPHKIAIGDLEKSKLFLESKRKVKINGTSYDIIIDNSVCETQMLLCDEKNIVLKSVSLKGITNLRSRIPKVHVPYESLMLNGDSNFLPLPDTKCRHPLFGVHYRKASKIPKAVAKQLYTTNSVPIDIVNKKKKKSKIKEQLKIESDIEAKPNVKLLQHRKKKRKHSDEKGTSKLKAKRIKYESDSVDAWESEQAIENNLFNF